MYVYLFFFTLVTKIISEIPGGFIFVDIMSNKEKGGTTRF